MRATIGRVHGAHRDTGSPREKTPMWCSTIRHIGLFILSILMVPLAAEAQQPQHVPRIGFLSAASAASISARSEAFRQGLRALGYVEGTNIAIEYRYAEGNPDRLRALAAELVHLKVDVIVTAGPTATRPAKEAISTIPIVMAFDSDPVGNGFVASLAQPGGNITGLSTLAPEISGKQLELLQEIVPRLAHVAVLGNATIAGNVQVLRETETVAQAVRVQLHYIDVPGPQDIETAFREASQARADAILVLNNPVVTAQRTQTADFAVKSRLPAIYLAREFVEAGGLMSYGVNINDLFRRAATYVDKILKGAKPADLPVEQPMQFELVINLKTAEALGLTIPPMVLFQADEVIK
jgi:putative ABC transport system substrate-binding protein